MLSGCVTPGYRTLADSRTLGFAIALTPTKTFSLTTAYRPSSGTSGKLPLRVYIEGDGRAWLSRNRASNDPTPSNPVALKMAMRDRSGAPILYLARPCQFEGRDDLACEQEAWTSGRFAPPVIDSVTEAIASFSRSVGADSVILIGYSGGGAVAALGAARLQDVALLVTVAAPLDHELWTRLHGVSSLIQSMQPIDYVDTLSGVAQRHLVGGQDTIVPEAIVDAFVDRLEPSSDVRKLVLEDYDHICCWVDDWEELQALMDTSP